MSLRIPGIVPCHYYLLVTQLQIENSHSTVMNCNEIMVYIEHVTCFIILLKVLFFSQGFIVIFRKYMRILNNILFELQNEVPR